MNGEDWKRGKILKGSQFRRDRENDFNENGREPSPSPARGNSNNRAEALRCAAQALSGMEINNAMEHARKVISVAREFENFLSEK